MNEEVAKMVAQHVIRLLVVKINFGESESSTLKSD